MDEEYLFPHVFDTTRLRHVDELKRAGVNAADYWAAERARLDTIIASAKRVGRPITA